MRSSCLKRAFWPLAACLAGLALYDRLPWLLKADKYLDADHAVWGLMARHIAQGLHWPLYMYGQGYMGAGEAYYLAPFFGWFGSSPKVMAWAMSGMFLLALLLLAWLARRLAGEGPALGTLLLTALAPPFFIRLTLLSYGGYLSVGLWGVLLWLVWSQVYLTPGAPRPGMGRLGLIALLAALGWWTWAPFWFFVLPCLLLHFAALVPELRPWPGWRGLWQRHPAHLMGLGALAAGFGVKLLIDLAFYLGPLSPWGGYVPLQHPVGPGRMLANLGLLWTNMIPEAFAPHAPLNPPWLGRLLFLAVLAASLGVAVSAWRAWRQDGLLAWLRANWLAAACASGWLALLLALVFTSATVDGESVRYLTVSLWWWPYLLVWGVAVLWRRARWAGALAGAGVAGVLAAAALMVALHPAAWHVDRWQEPYGTLLKALEREGMRYGWADYWEAYKLSFLSGEAYVVSPRPEYPGDQARYPPYADLVARAPRQAYLFRPKLDGGALRRVRARLKAQGVPFREEKVGRYRIIWARPGPCGGAKDRPR
ncbi:MAG: hypothetical protein K9K66_04630 [Desulfarculaceae bacterium]|nr:hypothetical protein [Desulfarculaceae bacterium]MCF8072757.1 hypothetical protein [Desulfarculaceae bacterium]MCF8100925.1 hypothetical protein [Desulfarculaceae bacterium]MCF8118553.1 hypothetical protein [Desulfarculaceae bacterium]